VKSLLRILAVGVGLLSGGTVLAQSAGTEAFINAPLAEVWAAFTEPQGLARLGATQASVDLRVGGEIRVQYAADGAATMVQEILAYDPQRMLALRDRAGAQNAASTAWSVIYFTPSGEDMTHVRIVSLGDNGTAGAHHRQLLDRLAKHYWPQCALCKAEAEAGEID
jgi:uncharacterized protein YndB with AHSA1/START domain